MKKKESHTFYNYQFKYTAVTITNHPDILAVDVAEALGIHPIMLYRWRGEMRTGKIKDYDQEARSHSELIQAQKKIKQIDAAEHHLKNASVAQVGNLAKDFLFKIQKKNR